MTTASDQPDRSENPEVPVIPVAGFRSANDAFVHRVPPVSQTTKAQKHLGEAAGVDLSPALLERLTHIAVEPSALDGIRPEQHRVETGWLSLVSLRVYSLLISLAIENDRLLAEAHYAADPQAKSRTALSMPQPHRCYAALVHGDAFEDLMESVDRAASMVKKDNPQEVGERLVERPLMLVSALFRTAGGQEAGDFTAVDGNSRLVSCWDRIRVERGWLDDTKDTTLISPLPSDLMRLTLHDRRELVRKVVKAAYKRLDNPQASDEERRSAAMALNALTVPAQIIVGYKDDEPSRGMQRFPAAVRSLLMRMNVGVKQFADGARHAVIAEEIVTGLYDEGLLGLGEDDSTAVRDILLGRGRVAEGMEELGFDPSLPDLRFAFVIEQLSRKEQAFNLLVRTKLHKNGLYLKDRNGPVVELGLRSYSASRTAREVASIRTALETGCLWQDLVDHYWEMENHDSDEAVDDLRKRAEEGEQDASLQLGVLGMVALVMAGHLLAPRGSAEALVDNTIARYPVGRIISSLLEGEAGRRLLADAVKRSRAGKRLRWWDPQRKRLVEQPAEWKGSTYDAHLRQAVRHGFDAADKVKNPAKAEADRLTHFQQSVVDMQDRLMDLIELREENGTAEKLAWLEVEAQMEILDRVKENFQAIAEPRPLRRW